ncbi:MAG: hypothetical protein EWM72_02211 [Nitrospira sp.]|nr:MAG: hypothetical protein EWM72_02211 [Nitrospira sp.]
MIRCAILRQLAITAMILVAVAMAYEVAWILTGQYGEVGALLYLAACLLSGILIPLRFILLSKATPMRRAIGCSVYLIALWMIWTMVWGDLALRYLDARELDRWQTTLLFYASTIGLPLLTAFSIGTLLSRTVNERWSTANQPH